MKKETLSSIGMILLTLLILILTFIVVLNATGQQFLDLCASHNWEGTYNITGDFSGEINCSEMWNNEYANGQWVDKCSIFPVSTKPNCKWLCTEDCKIFNAQSKEVNGMKEICVC